MLNYLADVSYVFELAKANVLANGHSMDCRQHVLHIGQYLVHRETIIIDIFQNWLKLAKTVIYYGLRKNTIDIDTNALETGYRYVHAPPKSRSPFRHPLWHSMNCRAARVYGIMTTTGPGPAWLALTISLPPGKITKLQYSN